MTAAAASTSVISLLTLGISLVFVNNINRLSTEIASQVEIHAFMKTGTDNYQVKSLQDEILKIPQVRRVEYISPDRALDKLQEDLNLDLEMSPEENPLPPGLVIRVGDPRQVGVVADQVKAMKGIAELQYGESILQNLIEISILVKFIGYLMTLLMALFALFTIMNTIRLTVLARKSEIRTMQLVGATAWFIRWPYALEGAILGIIGALIATGMIAIAYYILSGRIQSSFPMVIPMVEPGEMSRRILGTLVAAGIVMGVAGSHMSISRFLTEPNK